MVDQINAQSSKKSFPWGYCQEDDQSGVDLDHHALSLLANFDILPDKESALLLQASDELCSKIDTSNPRHHHNHQHIQNQLQHQPEPPHDLHSHHHLRSLERDTHPARRQYVGSVSDPADCVSLFTDLISGIQEVKFSQTRAFAATISANTIGQPYECSSPVISPSEYHGNQNDVLSPALMSAPPSSPNQSNWVQNTNNSNSGSASGSGRTSGCSANNINDSKASTHNHRDQQPHFLQRNSSIIHQTNKSNVIEKHLPPNQQSDYFTSYERPVSPKSSKVAYYNSDSNLENGGADTPNDADMSSLNCDLGNSDDCLSLSAEGGSISFLRNCSKGSKKSLDKGSDEYKRRRERNNVAVRKSREKAKQRSRDTEKKVLELQNENGSLKRKVDELSGQMMILRRLLNNHGISQDHIEDEINRTFQETQRPGNDY